MFLKSRKMCRNDEKKSEKKALIYKNELYGISFEGTILTMSCLAEAW